jgi:hypothetical protein
MPGGAVAPVPVYLPLSSWVRDAAHDPQRLVAIDGRLAEGGELVPAHLHVGRVVGVPRRGAA